MRRRTGDRPRPGRPPARSRCPPRARTSPGSAGGTYPGPDRARRVPSPGSSPSRAPRRCRGPRCARTWSGRSPPPRPEPRRGPRAPWAVDEHHLLGVVLQPGRQQQRAQPRQQGSLRGARGPVRGPDRGERRQGQHQRACRRRQRGDRCPVCGLHARRLVHRGSGQRAAGLPKRAQPVKPRYDGRSAGLKLTPAEAAGQRCVLSSSAQARGRPGRRLTVSAGLHNFSYMNGYQQVAQTVREALAPRFSVVPARRTRTQRRTWLDTFDWRLYRAGLTLEYVTGRGPAELVLSGMAGERITPPANGTRRPARAEALPSGPLRDRLEGVTWVRALLPAAKAASTVSEFRLCNADDKTVAWLTVEQLHAAEPAVADLPPRLSVTAVRGYQGQAARIARCLAAQPQVLCDGLPALDAVLATGGLAPGEYTSKVDVELSPAMPARMALAAVLLQLLGTLGANVPGTVRDIDT